MMLILPTLSEKEADAELAAIREAGMRIAASPERRRAFLTSLGFEVKNPQPIDPAQKPSAKPRKRRA